MTTLYTSDHEWLRIEGDVATIGITDYAQTQLGEEAVRIATGMWPMSLINPDVRHVVTPRKPARSWEVYSRELTVGRHR